MVRTVVEVRGIPLSKCEEIGLKIEKLEDDKKLQDLVLTVHCAYMHTFSMSPAIKIIENQIGVASRSGSGARLLTAVCDDSASIHRAHDLSDKGGRVSSVPKSSSSPCTEPLLELRLSPRPLVNLRQQQVSNLIEHLRVLQRLF